VLVKRVFFLSNAAFAVAILEGTFTGYKSATRWKQKSSPPSAEDENVWIAQLA
jgi:hypothetical protein